MKNFAWRSKPWFRTAILVLTIVATVLLAAHPELRLLLPVLDGLGLDLLVLLVGSQALAFALPMLETLWSRVLRPIALVGYRAFIESLGIIGPYVDGALTVRLRKSSDASREPAG
jgi:hypothetical protein